MHNTFLAVLILVYHPPDGLDYLGDLHPAFCVSVVVSHFCRVVSPPFLKNDNTRDNVSITYFFQQMLIGVPVSPHCGES